MLVINFSVRYHQRVSTPPLSGRAVDQLAEDIGRALLRFADTVREDAATPAETRRSDSRSRGRLQERVLELEGLSGEAGLAASEVAMLLEIAQSNATRVLHTLTERGDLERIAHERPSRWRVAQ